MNGVIHGDYKDIVTAQLEYFDLSTKIRKDHFKFIGSAIMNVSVKPDKSIQTEEKKPFEYKNKLEWVPEVIGFCAYVVMMSNDKMYKGFTGNFKNRMLQHFNGYGGSTTRRYPPIYIVHYEQFETKKEAMDREKFFKTVDGLCFLRDVRNLKTIRP